MQGERGKRRVAPGDGAAAVARRPCGARRRWQNHRRNAAHVRRLTEAVGKVLLHARHAVLERRHGRLHAAARLRTHERMPRSIPVCDHASAHTPALFGHVKTAQAPSSKAAAPRTRLPRWAGRPRRRAAAAEHAAKRLTP